MNDRSDELSNVGLYVLGGIAIVVILMWFLSRLWV